MKKLKTKKAMGSQGKEKEIEGGDKDPNQGVH